MAGPALRVSRPASPLSRPFPPPVFAHRGGRVLGPENTLPGLDLGLAAGADGLEFDVRLSRDGVPVLHHDPDLDRCTNARGPVDTYTAADLAGVDAAYWCDAAQGYPWRGRGIGVPTLADALARHARVPMIIEIKVGTADAARLVVAAICRAGAIDHVCVGSFSLVALQAVRSLDPRIATSAAREEVRWALYRSWVGLAPAAPAYRGFQVPEHAGRLTVVTPRFVRAVHRAALGVHVWTVNDERDMRRLLDWGVDGLISDRPDVAVRVRDAWAEERSQEGVREPRR
jgi:glycerophosphoryl diester phosphodiesterase